MNFEFCKVTSILSPSLTGNYMKWISELVKKYRPQLCCEVSHTNLENSMKLVMNCFETVNESHFGILFEHDDKPIVSIASSVDIESICRELLSKEYVFGIDSLCYKGGSTFDLSYDEESNIYEFMSISWGAYENWSTMIYEGSENSLLFRENDRPSIDFMHHPTA